MATRNTMTVDPQNILRSVDIVFQVMANFSKQYDGLFPAVADCQGCRMLLDFPLPAPIPGQRNSDRSPRGCNLAHDVGLLAALDGLGRSFDRERYTTLRKRYLETFAVICAPASPTGLLPWGEHSFWDLTRGGRIGNSYLLQYGEQPLDAPNATHHQMGMLPVEDWRVIHAANEQVIPRFVDGLDWHWDESHTLFNRHAPLTQFIRIDGTNRGHDFPAIAGIFIHDYAIALALVTEPRPAWRDALMKFCDSWWKRRLENGLCPKSGSDDPLKWNGPSLGMTLKLGRSLLAAAEVLHPREAGMAAVLRERGASLVRAVLDLPQPKADEGGFCIAFNHDGTPFKVTQPWAGSRGLSTTATTLVPVLDAAGRIGDDRGLTLAERCAGIYRTSFLPRQVIVRARDLGAVIALTTELHRLTGKQEWLDTALAHAADALELFFDSPLPRMAHGRRHYEAQQGSSELVHALARLALVAEGRECIGGLERPSC